MFVIILNSANVVPDGNNNTLVYNFPNSVVFKDKFIAVSQLVMYYAWFNIQSSYFNNTFTYTWTVGTISSVYTVLIPNGIYDIVEINELLQYEMINNGTYIINPAGDNIYYVDFITNVNRYAIQTNTYLVPTSLPSGCSLPSNFAGFPTQTFNPIVSYPANFYNIVGYYPVNNVIFSSNSNINNAYIPPTTPSSNDYYVEKDGAGTLSYLSNTSPQVQPNGSIYLSMSNINNPYSQPSSIIYAITPTVAKSEKIVEAPPNFMWTKLTEGTYNQLRLQFLGIDKQPIGILDPNMTITLVIRDKDETLLSIK